MTIEHVFDDDSPESTETDFARARPASEVLPPEFLTALNKGERSQAIEESTHLLSTETNTTRLKRGIAELNAGLCLERDLIQP